MNEELIRKIVIAIACIVIPGGLALGASFALRRFRAGDDSEIEPSEEAS